MTGIRRVKENDRMGRSDGTPGLSGIVGIIACCGAAAVGMTIVTGALAHWLFIGGGILVSLMAVQAINGNGRR